MRLAPRKQTGFKMSYGGEQIRRERYCEMPAKDREGPITVKNLTLWILIAYNYMDICSAMTVSRLQGANFSCLAQGTNRSHLSKKLIWSYLDLHKFI